MIEIYAVSYGGRAQPPELAGSFGPDGGTLGRGADNRLSLPDPARHVSRVQAAIRFDGNAYLIRNASEANPLFLNDEEIGYGVERILVPGDSIRVGLYQLGVREAGAAAPIRPGVAPVATPPRPVVPASGPLDPLAGLGQDAPGLNPFADLLGTATPLAATGAASAARPAPPISSSNPFADLLGTAVAATPPAAAQPSAPGVASANPFADLLAPGPREPTPALRPGAAAGNGALPPTPIIPDDFDVFALPSRAPRNTDDPLRDLAGASIELKSVDANAQRSDLLEFKLERKAAPDDLLQGGTPSLVDPFQAVDPLELFGGAEDGLLRIGGDPLGGGAPMPDSLPELGANFRPPRSLPEPAAPAAATTSAPTSPAPPFSPPGRGGGDADPLAAIVSTARSLDASAPSPATGPAAAPSAGQPPAGQAMAARQPAPAAAPPAAPFRAQPLAPSPAAAAQDTDPLLAAFLRGTGMAGLQFPNGLTPEVMEALGAFLAGATAGTMALIAARRTVRREIGAEQTVVPRAASNPLKFMPTPEAAIMQMFGPRMPGFLPLAEALRAAFAELLAHDLGVVAGTRAAVDEALRFLDPEELQRAVTKGAVVERLLPNAREARLWDLYAERYREVRAGFEEGFQARFADAFRAAYAASAAKGDHGGGSG